MQIVIDIPDAAYNMLLSEQRLPRDLDLEYLVMHGTPLPMIHGRLIDAELLWNSYHAYDYDFYEALEDAPAIIEAYPESEE